MKIYVASSWRNEYQQVVVQDLRNNGHEVYDFKNPPNRKGFSWSDIDPNWKDWNNEEYIQALNHPLAIAGYNADFEGMKWADACVLVMPCGRSAHVEARWFAGAGKPIIVLLKDGEPELMYKVFTNIATDLEQVNSLLRFIDFEDYLKKLPDEKTIEQLKRIGELERNLDDRDKTIQRHIEHNKECGERQRAKLLSVYYLLSQFKKVGTHHEKGVATMYIKMVLEQMINEGDDLPLPKDKFPFNW